MRFSYISKSGFTIAKGFGITVFVEHKYPLIKTSVFFGNRLVSFTVPHKKHIKLRARAATKRAADIITQRPVYLIVDSTDCDHSNSVTARAYKNIFEAEAAIDSIYDNAEGATYIRRVSKQEYQQHTPRHRDLALEAFENGHSHTIRR